jgi:Fe-S cluster assembly iron-binding protein IscA
MLTVTDAAAAHLNAMLAHAPDDAAIRFALNGNQLEPRLDSSREGDTTFSYGERVVLLVEPQMSTVLGDRVLDAQTGEQGTQLTLTAATPE